MYELHVPMLEFEGAEILFTQTVLQLAARHE